MITAEYILKNFEENRGCSMYHIPFDRKEIIEIMNAYAVLKNSEKPKRVFSEIDPYGEEDWNDEDIDIRSPVIDWNNIFDSPYYKNEIYIPNYHA